MEDDQKLITKHYYVNQVVGCLKLIEKITKNRWKVQCINCNSIFELSTSALSRYKKENILHCSNCPKEHISVKYKEGDILGKCFKLIKFVGGNDWLVECIKCGRQQTQSLSNMNRHTTDNCYFCNHPTAERNPRANGGRKGSNILPIDERLYNYYSSRIIQQNKTGHSKYKEWKLTLKEYSYLIHLPCAYCGADPSINNSWNATNKRISVDEVVAINGIDRINSDLGYIPGNCVPCCTKCNRMKQDYTVLEFLELIDRILKFGTSLTTIEQRANELSRVESSDSKREESNITLDYDIV